MRTDGPPPLSVSTLVLLLGIFLYTRWRSYKGLKEGVYHVSAHHDGWEDIRENVLNYDEEGGGEEDQVQRTHTHTHTHTQGESGGFFSKLLNPPSHQVHKVQCNNSV